MAFTVTLYVSSSPVEKIGKSLSSGSDFICELKDDTSILNPMIKIYSTSNLSGYNYMYIPEFGRYYYINDISSPRNNEWDISAHVDVLETYKTAILANSAVIRRQQNRYNLYLDDPDFMSLNYDRIQTLKFPTTNAFSKSLEYILVVNGS